MKGCVIEWKIKLCFYDLIWYVVCWFIVIIVGFSMGNIYFREEILLECL